MRAERLSVVRLAGLARGLEAISKHVTLPCYQIGVTGTCVRVWSVYDTAHFVWWETALLGAERPFKPGRWVCTPDLAHRLGQLIANHGRRDAAGLVIVDGAGISIGLGDGRLRVGHGKRMRGPVPDDPMAPKGVFSAWRPAAGAAATSAGRLAAVAGFAAAASATGGLFICEVSASPWQSALVVTDQAGVTGAVALARGLS